MGSTAGRKAKPLSEFLLSGLAELGYRRMPYDIGGVPFYRHPRHPELRVSVVVGNLPGDTDVVADWSGQPPTRLSEDALLQRLRAQLATLESPVQAMSLSDEERASD